MIKNKDSTKYFERKPFNVICVLLLHSSFHTITIFHIYSANLQQNNIYFYLIFDLYMDLSNFFKDYDFTNLKLYQL